MCTPAPTGIHGPPRQSRDRWLEQVARRLDRGGAWSGPASAGRNSATTSSPTNLSIMPSRATRVSRGPVIEPTEQAPEGAGPIFSARPVDPRTSANSMLSSISAPPRAFSSCLKQRPQIEGFLSHRPRSIIRMNGAAGPAKGAAHNLQRGELGSIRKKPRPAAKPGSRGRSGIASTSDRRRRPRPPRSRDPETVPGRRSCGHAGTASSELLDPDRGRLEFRGA